MRLSRNQTEAYYSINGLHSLSWAKHKSWCRRISASILPLQSVVIEDQQLNFISVHRLSLIVQPTPENGCLPVILFLDGVAYSRFLATSVTVVFGRFAGSTFVFEVAFIPRQIDIQTALAKIIESFAHSPFNGLTFQLKCITADMPARVKAAGCPSYLSNIGGCPLCLLTKEQMSDYDNAELIEGATPRLAEPSHPLYPLLGAELWRFFPIAPMHCLYGYTGRFFTEYLLATSAAWQLDLGGSVRLRKELIDQALGICTIPTERKCHRPSLLSPKTFRFSDWKTLSGIATPILPLLASTYRQTFAALLALVAAVETTGVSPELRLSVYWLFARLARSCNLDFVPNIHALFHLCTQEHGLSANEDLFEKHVQFTHSDVRCSNKRDIELHLIRSAQIRLSLGYHFASVLPSFTISAALAYLTTTPQPVHLTTNSQTMYYAKGSFVDSNNCVWMPASTNSIDELLSTGLLRLHNTNVADYNISQPRSPILGCFSPVGFEFTPLTPGWQSVDLVVDFLSSLVQNE